MDFHPKLQQYIDFCSETSIADYYYIVDSEFRYVAASQSFLEINNDLDMVGKRLKETHSIFRYLAPQYRKYSESFFASTRLHGHAISSLKVDNHLRFFDVRFSKIMEHNKVLGLLGVVNNYRPDHVLLRQLGKFNKNIFINLDGALPNTENVTELHLEIIWLICLGNLNKQISLILSSIYDREIKDSSVSATIRRQIYPLFDVNSQSELIKVAASSSLMDIFPLRLWNYYTNQTQ